MDGKKYFATLSGLALILAAVTPALAAGDEAKASSKVDQTVAVEKQTTPRRLIGEIVSIDQAKKIVAVKHKNPSGKESTVVTVVDDHTRIREGKTDKSVADLKVGEHVRINYERQDKRDLAREILIQSDGK
jgi:hypothetical protein